MVSSAYKSVQLCSPKAKAVYTGLHAYWNGFVEACQHIVYNIVLGMRKGNAFEFLWNYEVPVGSTVFKMKAKFIENSGTLLFAEEKPKR